MTMCDSQMASQLMSFAHYRKQANMLLSTHKLIHRRQASFAIQMTLQAKFYVKQSGKAFQNIA